MGQPELGKQTSTIREAKGRAGTSSMATGVPTPPDMFVRTTEELEWDINPTIFGWYSGFYYLDENGVPQNYVYEPWVTNTTPPILDPNKLRVPIPESARVERVDYHIQGTPSKVGILYIGIHGDELDIAEKAEAEQIMSTPVPYIAIPVLDRLPEQFRLRGYIEQLEEGQRLEDLPEAELAKLKVTRYRNSDGSQVRYSNLKIPQKYNHNIDLSKVELIEETMVDGRLVDPNRQYGHISSDMENLDDVIRATPNTAAKLAVKILQDFPDIGLVVAWHSDFDNRKDHKKGDKKLEYDTEEGFYCYIQSPYPEGKDPNIGVIQNLVKDLTTELMEEEFSVLTNKREEAGATDQTQIIDGAIYQYINDFTPDTTFEGIAALAGAMGLKVREGSDEVVQRKYAFSFEPPMYATKLRKDEMVTIIMKRLVIPFAKYLEQQKNMKAQAA